MVLQVLDLPVIYRLNGTYPNEFFVRQVWCILQPTAEIRILGS